MDCSLERAHLYDEMLTEPMSGSVSISSSRRVRTSRAGSAGMMTLSRHLPFREHSGGRGR